jgi:hypothetical protein
MKSASSQYDVLSAAVTSTNRMACFSMILAGTVAPQNTPRSVTMLPIDKTPAPFVPDLEPIRDPLPHYMEYANAVVEQRKNYPAWQTKKPAAQSQQKNGVEK